MAKYAGEHVTCIVTGAPGSDLHHLKTRASGGTDDEYNLIPLSHMLHVQLHSKGLNYMADKFPAIHGWLVQHGWEWDEYSKRWIHE